MTEPCGEAAAPGARRSAACVLSCAPPPTSPSHRVVILPSFLPSFLPSSFLPSFILSLRPPHYCLHHAFGTERAGVAGAGLEPGAPLRNEAAAGLPCSRPAEGASPGAGGSAAPLQQPWLPCTPQAQPPSSLPSSCSARARRLRPAAAAAASAAAATGAAAAATTRGRRRRWAGHVHARSLLARVCAALPVPPPTRSQAAC